MDAPLLSIRGLTKRYGDFVALDDANLEVGAGEIFALLGPNGAGKTTLIGCVTGLIARYDGEIRVAGYDVRRDARVTRRAVGLVPQEINQDAFFSVRDVIALQGGYFGVRPDDPRHEELLRAFALTEKAEANTRQLSGGMKRRLMICKALIHDPVLLFLDEPTAGVDVELREELWEYVLRLRARGTTIVLTTHYIEEAEKLADRVGFLHKGRLGKVAPRDELMSELGRREIRVELGAEAPEAAISALAGLEIERPEPRTLVVSWRRGDEGVPDRVLRALIGAGCEVRDVRTAESSLESIFKNMVHGAPEDGSLEGSR